MSLNEIGVILDEDEVTIIVDALLLAVHREETMDVAHATDIAERLNSLMRLRKQRASLRRALLAPPRWRPLPALSAAWSPPLRPLGVRTGRLPLSAPDSGASTGSSPSLSTGRTLAPSSE